MKMKKMKKLAIPLGRPCAKTNCLQHEGGLVYNNLAPQGKPGGLCLKIWGWLGI